MTYIPPGITYPEIQKIADERDQARARVAELERLISDDSFAITFQTLGQYRSALLKAQPWRKEQSQ